jgi:hypothetical protein
LDHGPDETSNQDIRGNIRKDDIFCAFIKEICPKARFIYLVRHSGAVVRSGMRRKWYETNCTLNRHLIHPSAGDPYFHEWETAPTFEKICWYCNTNNTFALRSSATIPAERMLLLKAEDLFKGRTETMKRLFQFLGVKLPSEDLIQTVLDKKMNLPLEDQFPVVEEWDESECEILISIAGKTMEALEYSLENGLG